MEKYIYKCDVYTAELSFEGIRIVEKGDVLCTLMPSTRVLSVSVAEDDILDSKGNVKTAEGSYYDVDDEDERIISFEAKSESVFVWEAESSLWRKTYTVECDNEGLT